MSTIVPPTVSTNSALLKGVSSSPGAGGATQVPPGILALPAGTVLRGQISQIDGRGNAVLSTAKGDVSLQTDLPIKLGSEVALRLTISSDAVRARILSINGLTPQEFSEKSAQPRGQSTHVDDIVQTGKQDSAAKAAPAKTSSQPAQTQTTNTAATTPATQVKLPADALTLRAVLLSRAPNLPQILQQLPSSISLPIQRLEAGASLSVRLVPQTIQLPQANLASGAATTALPTGNPAQTTGATAATSTTTATTTTPPLASTTSPTATASGQSPASIPPLSTAAATTTPGATQTQTTTPNTAAAATASTSGQSGATAATTTPASRTTGTPQAGTAQSGLTPTTATTNSATPSGASVAGGTATSTPTAGNVQTAGGVGPAATPAQNLTGATAANSTAASTNAATGTPNTTNAPAGSATPTPPAATNPTAVATANTTAPATTAAATPNANALPAQLAQGILPAQVIGHEQSGETVVKTAFGTLKISIPSPSGPSTTLPVGTQFTLQLDRVSQPQIPLSPLAPTDSGPAPLSELSASWKSLQQAVEVLAQSQPALAAQVIDTIIPKPGPKMAAATLFFISALRGGNVRQWLGSKAMEALEQGQRGDLTRKLTAEFGTLRQFFVDSPSPNWQAIFVPVHHEEQWHQARLFLKKEPEGGAEGDGGGTRFIMEVELSRMGPMQFDGFIRRRAETTKFDLIIRSRNTLSETDRQNIRDIYQSSSELTGFAGGISFQVTNPFPVLPMQEILSDVPDVMA